MSATPTLPSASHSTRTYLVVIGIVLFFVLVSAAVSRLNLPVGTKAAIILGIAGFQVALSAAYFMHLNAERAFIYGFLILTALFFALLVLLPLLTGADQTGKRLETRPAATESSQEIGSHVH